MNLIQLENRNRQHFITAMLAFCILFHFSNSLLINLTNLAFLYLNKGFYFLLCTNTGFSTFYIRLLFTPNASMGCVLYLTRISLSTWGLYTHYHSCLVMQRKLNTK